MSENKTEVFVGGAVLAAAIAFVIYIFGGKIYRWDVNIVYGRIFKKLETMIADMEELRD